MALGNPYPSCNGRPASRDATPSASGEAELLAGAELLPCGRPLGRSWQQARDPSGPPDPHRSSCPHCREAVEGLTALDGATRALRAKEQPDIHGLANRIINAVRGEVRLGSMLLLDDPGHDLRIAESAAAKVLRRAADTVPGVRAASCRIITSKERTAHAVTITLAVTLDRPLPGRAEAVREAVLERAEHALGLTVTTVNVEINAVLETFPLRDDELSEMSGR
ncbi:Asp23/Gls24 family envelope stress response protein [Streptomyces sp. A0592]|uniref:Asp23/Gls24 family envelope stress response protein n=1 Tax=Streptomyces sp. A0592 TaxID=2563099 RepID=UPI00109E7B6C|nr:Asp23/Gls24 family envelope stress response protein [Streptomyces sp. A0592]THA75442.1 Asp23/Gls24 family envelope stress response protein [Streptomyces sp. A0592]